MRIIEKLLLRFVVRSTINRYLGRIFFHNDGGLISNLIGTYVRRRDAKKACLSGAQFGDVDPVALQLSTDGFVLIDELADQSVISKLRQSWEVWASEKSFPDDGRLELSSADESEELITFIPSLAALITSEIQDTIRSYFQSHFRIVNYHIYRNRRPANRSELNSFGATANWHTDGSTSESIKLFFMLSEIGPENGPMEIISRTDTRKVMGSGLFFFPDKFNKTSAFIDQECTKHTLQGEPGRSFFALTNDVLHRATLPAAEEVRDLLVFYITSSSRDRSVTDQLKSAKYREIIGIKRLFMN